MLLLEPGYHEINLFYRRHGEAFRQRAAALEVLKVVVLGGVGGHSVCIV